MSERSCSIDQAHAKTMRAARWVVMLSLVLVGIDFRLGPLIQLPVLFVFPVMWAAWSLGGRFATILALSLVAARFACHWYWDFPLALTPAVVNNVLRAIGLLSVAIIIARLAGIVRDLRHRVVLLEARLPVCGICGVIKEADGSWRPLDIGAPPPRSRIRCSACEERHYGSVS